MSPPLAERLLAPFAERLLAWFDASHRDLPWRRRRTPYTVVVSEMMLQQTTVAAAIPYFERFTARFPDWRALAEAREDEVLAAWAGLGYYRRARALQGVARAVVAEGGEFPSTLEGALALPGIGPYTAGAVLSLAFGARQPAVDGNVGRVLSRHRGEALDAARTRDRRRLEEEVRALQCVDRPGAFNEALMELGATTCTPRSPACLLCPVQDDCVARRTQSVGALTPRRARTEPTRIRAAAALIVRGGDVLFARRADDEAVLPGMWELPGGWTEVDPRTHLETATLPALGGGRVLEKLGVVRHAVTTRRIEVEVHRCELDREVPVRDDLAWRAPDAAGDLALTSAARRALALVKTACA